MIAIRGTATNTDALVDLKLWFGSALYQMVQAIIPIKMPSEFLNMFRSLQDVSDTTTVFRGIDAYMDAVEERMAADPYLQVFVAGHSLGNHFLSFFLLLFFICLRWCEIK